MFRLVKPEPATQQNGAKRSMIFKRYHDPQLFDELEIMAKEAGVSNAEALRQCVSCAMAQANLPE